MQRLSNSNNTVSLFPGIDGDVQLAIGPRGLIVLDCQGASRGTDGRVYHNHGTVRLTRDAARELAEFIEHIDEVPDPRQPMLPALWSEATFVEPIRRPAHPRRRRAA